MSTPNPPLRHPVVERPAGRPSGMLLMSTTFVHLVFESDAIVVGSVGHIGPAGPAGTPEFLTFQVTRSYRHTLPNRIRVAMPPSGFAEQPIFRQGEACVLFLTGVTQAGGTLIGEGDMGKWPRPAPNWLFTAGHVQPLDQVVRVVEALLEVDGMNRYEDRATALTRAPFVDNMLGQIGALQYAADLERWPQDRLQGEINLRTARSFVAARTLLDKKPLDLAAEIELVHQLLEDCPPSVAFPKWIERLTHRAVGVRNTAFAVLQAVAEEDFEYDARAAERQRTEAVARWQKWYQQKRPELLRQDVPKLLEDLRSKVLLRRETADLLLRVLSEQDVKFVADDTETSREAAVKRWEDWWNTTNAALPP